VKRLWIILTFVMGAAIAAFFISHNAGNFSVSDSWENFKSLLRRAQDKIKGVGVQGLEEINLETETGYEKALRMIADFEGFSARAYKDASGYSIGYGHFIIDGDGYTKDSVVTEEQAYAQLAIDAQSAESCVNTYVSRELNANQQAALISLAYNIGCGNFKSSTMVRLINAGDFDNAALEFAKWNKSNKQILTALVNRRESEMEVFVS
jgi:lysozyme